MTNAKLQFLSERLKRRHPTLVYTVDIVGNVHSFTIDPFKNWTLSSYGFVPDNSLSLSSAWTRWDRVFHMVCREDHCVDWPLIPSTVLDGSANRSQLRQAYTRYARNVTWVGDVSIGSKPQFAQNVKPERRNKKLPRGWRVIQGGA